MSNSSDGLTVTTCEHNDNSNQCNSVCVCVCVCVSITRLAATDCFSCVSAGGGGGHGCRHGRRICEGRPNYDVHCYSCHYWYYFYYIVGFTHTCYLLLSLRLV